jgi:hypothetical protein
LPASTGCPIQSRIRPSDKTTDWPSSRSLRTSRGSRLSARLLSVARKASSWSVRRQSGAMQGRLGATWPGRATAPVPRWPSRPRPAAATPPGRRLLASWPPDAPMGLAPDWTFPTLVACAVQLTSAFSIRRHPSCFAMSQGSSQSGPARTCYSTKAPASARPSALRLAPSAGTSSPSPALLNWLVKRGTPMTASA